jgi:branched-subunit amino acid aminotransferase/4-amino-4-deoxychorismate lyase
MSMSIGRRMGERSAVRVEAQSAAFGQNPSLPLLVADSFRVRVRAGRAEVRALPRHLARFRASARLVATELSLPLSFFSDLDDFLETIPGSVVEGGEGFPRLEMRSGSGDSDPDLHLSIRPLPQLSNTIDMRTTGNGPLRALPHPERKGPGIPAYSEMRNTLGAEPLIINDHGHIIEGGTTSLLWWVGTEACVVASTTRVASITERLVTELLVKSGVRVCARLATTAELMTTEVWAFNALHGIRPVRSIDGRLLAIADSERLSSARAGLDSYWAAVS